MQQCDTPYCGKLIPSARLKRPIKGYYFCGQCRDEHSYRVLVAQADHDAPIKDILLQASTFRSAEGMAAYIGVSFVTIYHWIRRYFNLSFQEFRRQHICKNGLRGKCYLLDIRRSSYTRHDYVLKKIRSKRYCACINALEGDLIMTNAPVDVVQSLMRGMPKIEQISDDKYALVPDPIKASRLRPIYFDLHQVLPVRKRTARKKKTPARSGLSFFDKLLLALHEMGGRADVGDLRQRILTNEGKPARKNNTRREVYRHPDLLRFDDKDSQQMMLTNEGSVHAEKLMADQGKSAAII